jgi:hypothetical protein
MNALTVILGIWAMLALCAVLFIRGASRRVERPAQEAQEAPKTSPSRFSIAE